MIFDSTAERFDAEYQLEVFHWSSGTYVRVQ